jgi:hypothetical protein
MCAEAKRENITPEMLRAALREWYQFDPLADDLDEFFVDVFRAMNRARSSDCSQISRQS